MPHADNAPVVIDDSENELKAQLHALIDQARDQYSEYYRADEGVLDMLKKFKKSVKEYHILDFLEDTTGIHIQEMPLAVDGFLKDINTNIIKPSARDHNKKILYNIRRRILTLFKLIYHNGTSCLWLLSADRRAKPAGSAQDYIPQRHFVPVV
jgi:hypothetical protein